jgi:hypothetical protein
LREGVEVKAAWQQARRLFQEWRERRLADRDDLMVQIEREWLR